MNAQWQVDRFQATYQDATWRIQFDAERPQLGLTLSAATVACPETLTVQLPGADPIEPVDECYARCEDLVVAYQQHSGRSVKPHIYYRVRQASNEGIVVQLIVSMQTSLLQSSPSTIVQSKLKPGEVQYCDADGRWSHDDVPTATVGFLSRPSEAQHSFFQFVHPTDHFRTLETEQSPTAGFELFPESLEKGVIRRARVIAGWAPRKDDLQTASEYLSQLRNEAPPLTT